MTENQPDRLVVSYLGEDHYHRGDSEDDMRPACNPRRIRGVVAIRTEAERRGQTQCPDCWPDDD